MMTRAELIEYIEKEQTDLLGNIDSADDRIIMVYYEYDTYVKKILEVNLDMDEIRDCFLAMENLYMIKHIAASCLLDEQLLRAYRDIIIHILRFFDNTVDLMATLKDAEENVKRQEELGIVVEKKIFEPQETDEKLQFDRISLLEFIIGEKEEFNTVMGR